MFLVSLVTVVAALLLVGVAVVVAETVLVYIALGLAGVSAVLLTVEMVRHREALGLFAFLTRQGGSTQDPRTGGLGKAPVPVAPDTAAAQLAHSGSSARVPASAEPPVRGAVGPGGNSGPSVPDAATRPGEEVPPPRVAEPLVPTGPPGAAGDDGDEARVATDAATVAEPTGEVEPGQADDEAVAGEEPGGIATIPPTESEDPSAAEADADEPAAATGTPEVADETSGEDALDPMEPEDLPDAPADVSVDGTPVEEMPAEDTLFSSFVERLHDGGDQIGVRPVEGDSSRTERVEDEAVSEREPDEAVTDTSDAAETSAVDSAEDSGEDGAVEDAGEGATAETSEATAADPPAPADDSDHPRPEPEAAAGPVADSGVGGADGTDGGPELGERDRSEDAEPAVTTEDTETADPAAAPTTETGAASPDSGGGHDEEPDLATDDWDAEDGEDEEPDSEGRESAAHEIVAPDDPERG